MNTRSAMLTAVSLLVAGLFTVFVWPMRYSYHVIPGSVPMLLRVDRLTERVTVIFPTREAIDQVAPR